MTFRTAVASLLLLSVIACSDQGNFDDPSPPAPDGSTGSKKLTIAVVVIDSLMPNEIGAALTPTPNLVGFKDNGTFYAESRSVFSAETIPNHVAMMTGMYPAHNGIPTNNYWNRSGEFEERDLSLPTELEADTLFTTIGNLCPNLKTASVLSKNYLYEVFSECGFSGSDCGQNRQSDNHWDPTASPLFIPSPAGLTPDLATMDAARSALPDADFIFVNLGEVDRVGHVDETGNTGIPALRNTSLNITDQQIGMFISDLQAAGRWENTVMFIVSDHGMDWSLLLDYVNLQPILDDIGGLVAVQNGGTDSIYLADQSERGTQAGYDRLAAARAAILATPGVANAWYVEANPAEADPSSVLPFDSRHENLGDLVVSAEDGQRFTEPDTYSNPIPGNHGHSPTLQNTLIVGGGASFIKAQYVGEPDEPVDHFERRPGQSENVDIAPTIAWLLGLPTGAYDGRALKEAFDLDGAPSACGVLPNE